MRLGPASAFIELNVRRGFQPVAIPIAPATRQQHENQCGRAEAADSETLKQFRGTASGVRTLIVLRQLMIPPFPRVPPSLVLIAESPHNGTNPPVDDSRSNQEVSMADNTRADRYSFGHHQSHQSFHNMPKRLWDEEVVRIIKASKGSQRRMAGWAPELDVHPRSR